MKNHIVILSLLVASCSSINNDTVNNQTHDSIGLQTENDANSQADADTDTIDTQISNINGQNTYSTNNPTYRLVIPPSRTVNKQPVNYITAHDVLSACHLPDKKFHELTPQWQLSEFVISRYLIQYDFNKDTEEDVIALLDLAPTDLDYRDYCTDDDDLRFIVLVDLSNSKTVLTNFGADFASGAKITQLDNGFTLDYSIGQGRKCFFTASFTVDNNNTYLSNAVTECDESNTGSNKMTYPQTNEYLIENINLPDIFEEVRAQSDE